MEEFAERMLERTRKRQELLTTSKVPLPMPLSPPAMNTLPPSNEDKSPIENTLPQVQQLLTSPARLPRRNRLAELSSRVDLWLANEATDHVSKSNENNLPLTVSMKSENSSTNQQAPIKLKSVPSCDETITPAVKKIKSNKIETTFAQQNQLDSKKNVSKLQQLQKQSSDSGHPPQWQSPNLTSAPLTVAQRRALFEKNIADAQQLNIKPFTTTTVTKISETADATSATTTSISTENEINTPPHSIRCNASTPPSRCETRYKKSPAIIASGISELSPKKRHPWTPPCIKNVLLKKRLINELDDEQISENETSGTAAATSSPISSNTLSSADRIAMSVGHVKFVPSSPNGGLYPDLSRIEENNEETTSLENQSTRLKRRSNGSSALNTSTTSSESISETDDDKISGTKRSRCEFMNNKSDIALLTKSSPITPANTTPGGGQSSSMLSGHAADSPLSQACTSFIYHHNVDDPNHLFEFSSANLTDLELNKSEEKLLYPDGKNLENCSPELLPNSAVAIEKPCMNSGIKPALVHTVSTYRKQQQQLRLGGTPGKHKTRYSEEIQEEEEEEESSHTLFQRRMQLLNDEYCDDDDDDEEEYKLQEIEAVAERARYLERTVVPEQDRIIEQATQALNICDVYRQKEKNGLRPVINSNFSPEHVHAERLLLIAGLRRTDAVLEAQRLRVERTILPSNNSGKKIRHLKVCGSGKTLVIDSLRVPILAAIFSSGNNNKAKHSTNEEMENLTRWPGGYRYFVCAIRAVATVHRSPVTAATRPADAVEESLLRFSIDNHHNNDEIGYGYVEFITKKQVKSSVSRKCTIPSESQGAPIMIHGLDDGGWKITVELYGLPQVAGEYDNQKTNGKEHDSHDNSRSVLDKLWSTVTTPNKELKKHHATATRIDSPKGPTAVRNTVFRQLGYFVFSDGQVDRQQFTLNKVHQPGGIGSKSRTIEETVRIHMRLLDDGEQYIYDNDDMCTNSDILSINKCVTKKPLKLPAVCKLVEGFLTLFDDDELRAKTTFERGQHWQRHSDIGGRSGGTTLWRRLWFRVEIVDDPIKLKTNHNDFSKEHKQNNTMCQKTIVLRYWMYPEHAEQQREPLGAINLVRCLPSQPSINECIGADSGHQQQDPASPAPPDLCTRPNTLRLILYNNEDHNGIDNDVGVRITDSIDDPLLLSADTTIERREWCETINGAVRALGEYRNQIRLADLSHEKQIVEKNKKNQFRSQEQQHTNAWPMTPSGSGNNCGKKKKFYR